MFTKQFSRTISRLPYTPTRYLSTSLYMFGDSACIPTLSASSSSPSSPSGNILSPRLIDTDQLRDVMLKGYEGSKEGMEIKDVYVGKGKATAVLWEDKVNKSSDVLTLHAPDVPSLGGFTGVVSGLGMSEVTGCSIGVKHMVITGIEEGGGEVTKSMGSAGTTIEGYGQLGLGGNLGDSNGAVSVPTTIQSLIDDVTPLDQVSASGTHTVGLCMTTNEVVTTGSGQYGRLGNVDAVDQLFFEPVELLMTIPEARFVKVTTGNSFTITMCDKGEVWGWGRNDKGQLGLGGGISMDVYAMENMPNKIEFFEVMGIEVVDVAAGKDHSAAVDKEGRVWVWGGKSGFLEPNVVQGLPDDCKGVACGENVTAVYTEKGEVWTMSHGGSGGGVKVGCLGRGEDKGNREPGLVLGLTEEHTGGKIVKGDMGWAHAAFLVES